MALEQPLQSDISGSQSLSFQPTDMRGRQWPPRLHLNHIPVDRVSMENAVTWILDSIKFEHSATPLLIMGPNAHLITLAERNSRFAAALHSANLAIPDGISVVLASRLLRQPVPERVTGGDLMERLCVEAARNNLSVFFLGGLPGAAELTARKFQRNYAGFRVVGVYCPPAGFESDPAECARIREAVCQAKPDFLFVAFGAPKQEIWMVENCPSLAIRAAMAVGAAFDTQSGLRKRAPKWTHKLGLEWFFRLAQEPRRLWRRYLIGNTLFLWLVFRQWCRDTWTNRHAHNNSSFIHE